MDAVWLRVLAGGIAAYLIGGIPFGLIVGKLFYKTDVRQHGSGNIGATNVLRTLGPAAGYPTFALDFLKGSAAVLVAWVLVPASVYGVEAYQWAGVVATVAVMLGHSYSPYLRFTGGKGVATAAGAIVVLFTWKVWVPEILLFAAIILLFRLVSLGSVTMALALPILVWSNYRAIPDDVPMLVFGVAASAIVLWRHRANIGRIARGEEARIDLFRRSEEPPKGDSGSNEGI